MKYLLVILLLTSCGSDDSDFIKNPFNPKEEDPRSIKTINPIFDDYYQSFEADCGVHISIPIDFAEVQNGKVGVCTWWKSEERTYKQIAIKKEFWESADEAQREWLIYHELGHCALNKDHNDEYFDNGRPKSIMNSFVPFNADLFYFEDKDYYIEELCQ